MEVDMSLRSLGNTPGAREPATTSQLVRPYQEEVLLNPL